MALMAILLIYVSIRSNCSNIRCRRQHIIHTPSYTQQYEHTSTYVQFNAHVMVVDARAIYHWFFQTITPNSLQLVFFHIIRTPATIDNIAAAAVAIFTAPQHMLILLCRIHRKQTYILLHTWVAWLLQYSAV